MSAGWSPADPGQGGAAWAVLQYVLGLRRLGHEVLLVEQVRADALHTEYFDVVDGAGRRAAWTRAGPCSWPGPNGPTACPTPSWRDRAAARTCC